MSEAGVLVAGVGNDLRGDDGVGLAVVRRLRTRRRERDVEILEMPGDAIALLDHLPGRRALVVVDAVRSGAAPGTIHRLDASRAALREQVAGTASTHALSLGGVLELGRALHRLPPVVIVYGVEAVELSTGPGLSSEVSGAVGALTERVHREVQSHALGA